MPVLFIYLLKLSISLALVYLFYQLLLRRLTFYNSNRWYLLGYSILSLVIPLINISPVIEQNRESGNKLFQYIPVIKHYTEEWEVRAGDTVTWWNNLSLIDGIFFIILMGIAFLLCRFMIRLFSFHRIRSRSTLLFGNEIKLYQVNEKIIPFSF